MSGDRYFINDQHSRYFLTPTVIHWIDLFTRKEYRDVLVDSLKYCQATKGLEIYAWVIMSNHIHLVAACPPLALVCNEGERGLRLHHIILNAAIILALISVSVLIVFMFVSLPINTDISFKKCQAIDILLTTSIRGIFLRLL